MVGGGAQVIPKPGKAPPFLTDLFPSSDGTKLSARANHHVVGSSEITVYGIALQGAVYDASQEELLGRYPLVSSRAIKTRKSSQN